jgi:hypothetical protein
VAVPDRSKAYAVKITSAVDDTDVGVATPARDTRDSDCEGIDPTKFESANF